MWETVSPRQNLGKGRRTLEFAFCYRQLEGSLFHLPMALVIVFGYFSHNEVTKPCVCCFDARLVRGLQSSSKLASTTY